MMKAADIETASATRAMRVVPTAPPSGVIISSEDAIFVESPSPFTEIAKIVGNMIASKA